MQLVVRVYAKNQVMVRGSNPPIIKFLSLPTLIYICSLCPPRILEIGGQRSEWPGTFPWCLPASRKCCPEYSQVGNMIMKTSSERLS